MGDLKVFVDSNVILQHLEGKIDLSKIRNDVNICTNIIIFSEVMYVYLKALTGKKSYELKKEPKTILKYKDEINDLYLFFQAFNNLVINNEIKDLSFKYIAGKGMLPNDAIILATCKYYGIKNLISFDSDFSKPCKQEKINLTISLSNIASLSRNINQKNLKGS